MSTTVVDLSSVLIHGAAHRTLMMHHGNTLCKLLVEYCTSNNKRTAVDHFILTYLGVLLGAEPMCSVHCSTISAACYMCPRWWSDGVGASYRTVLTLVCFSHPSLSPPFYSMPTQKEVQAADVPAREKNVEAFNMAQASVEKKFGEFMDLFIDVPSEL